MASVTFPYAADWIAQGWVPYVQATLAGGSLLTSAGIAFARVVAGNLVEIGVNYPAAVAGGATGIVGYTVSLVG